MIVFRQRCWSIFALAVLLTQGAFAQEVTAAISGQITDPSGANVANAEGDGKGPRPRYDV